MFPNETRGTHNVLRPRLVHDIPKAFTLNLEGTEEEQDWAKILLVFKIQGYWMVVRSELSQNIRSNNEILVHQRTMDKKPIQTSCNIC